MSEPNNSRPQYGSKVLATLIAKRERMTRTAERRLVKARQEQLKEAKLHEQYDENERLIHRKAARAQKRLASQRRNQHFAWGTLIERELLACRLDADYWRTVLARVFREDPAELSRAALGLEMQTNVELQPGHDRQVWRPRWGMAVEWRLQAGEISPEDLAVRVVRTLDTLDQRRGLAGIERVAGRKVEIPAALARGEVSPGHVARMAIAAGIWSIEATREHAEQLSPNDRDAVLHGLAAKAGALLPTEIFLFEHGLAALINKSTSAGQWTPEKTKGLADLLRRRGVLS
jgi:hypothetical protein